MTWLCKPAWKSVLQSRMLYCVWIGLNTSSLRPYHSLKSATAQCSEIYLSAKYVEKPSKTRINNGSTFSRWTNNLLLAMGMKRHRISDVRPGQVWKCSLYKAVKKKKGWIYIHTLSTYFNCLINCEGTGQPRHS